MLEVPTGAVSSIKYENGMFGAPGAVSRDGPGLA